MLLIYATKLSRFAGSLNKFKKIKLIFFSRLCAPCCASHIYVYIVYIYNSTQYGNEMLLGITSRHVLNKLDTIQTS